MGHALHDLMTGGFVLLSLLIGLSKLRFLANSPLSSGLNGVLLWVAYEDSSFSKRHALFEFLGWIVIFSRGV